MQLIPELPIPFIFIVTYDTRLGLQRKNDKPELHRLATLLAGQVGRSVLEVKMGLKFCVHSCIYYP